MEGPTSRSGCPCFLCFRLAEKNAESLQGVCRIMDGLERNGSHNSSDRMWRPVRLGKQLRGRHTRQTPLTSVSGASAARRHVYVHTRRPNVFSLPPQHNLKHAAEPLLRRNVPHHPADLPKLSVTGPQFSVPASTPPAFTAGGRGTLPAITAKKSPSRLPKVKDGQ